MRFGNPRVPMPENQPEKKHYLGVQIPKDKMEMDVEAYLRRRFESQIADIEVVENEDLDLAVMAEARSQQAASMTEFHWLGHRFPISNAKTKELEKDIHGPLTDTSPADKRLGIFDKIFSAYHEAKGYIRTDLAIAESVKDDLTGLDKAIRVVLGERTIERNLLLAKVAKSKLARRHDDKNEKVTKPEELVCLYDVLLHASVGPTLKPLHALSFEAFGIGVTFWASIGPILKPLHTLSLKAFETSVTYWALVCLTQATSRFAT
ncbi:DNA polymerase epsilon catalytic subunit A [Spatholobus suberectus]|nr:DNA polymerase epsilon catalytic subunit A [Spatholobus suberectus]